MGGKNVYVTRRIPQAGIELYRKGRPLVREMFGPVPDLPAPSTPSISYGHINALGIELVFPEGGEVNYERNDMSLTELTQLLRKDIRNLHSAALV